MWVGVLWVLWKSALIFYWIVANLNESFVFLLCGLQLLNRKFTPLGLPLSLWEGLCLFLHVRWKWLIYALDQLKQKRVLHCHGSQSAWEVGWGIKLVAGSLSSVCLRLYSCFLFWIGWWLSGRRGKQEYLPAPRNVVTVEEADSIVCPEMQIEKLTGTALCIQRQN